MGFEVIDNRNNALGCGPGVQAAQQMIAKGVKVVITGKCGPKAVQVFSTAGVDVYTGQAGTAKSVITAHRNGKLTAKSKVNLVLPSGMGGHGHDQGQCTCHERDQQAGKGVDNGTCRTNAK